MASADSCKRRDRFQRNPKLEELLTELRTILEPAEQAFLVGKLELKYPVMLVIGAPRSGTTILMQWLASTGLIAYPSNLLSRFFASPYVGARIQQLLTDPNFRFGNELAFAGGTDAEFASTLGKTEGLLAPNEFWYFWRRFIPNEQPEQLSPEEEASIDVDGFRRGIAAIQLAFDKPFATKGIILQYNLSKLQEILPRCLFLHTKRDGVFNAQSLVEARRTYYGDIEAWYSARPPGYEELLERDPYVQVAGQIHLTNESIRQQFDDCDDANKLTVAYEEFCANPTRVFSQIVEKLAGLDYQLENQYRGPSHFEAKNTPRVSDEEFERIKAAWGMIRSGTVLKQA